MSNQIKVAGLDVSKSSVCVCILLSKPDNIREFFHKCQFEKFEANGEDLKRLIALNPDIVVLEPTGVNYSKLWVERLRESGCEIKLVGHKELAGFRNHHLGLPDKDDEADALALACYYWEYQNSPSRFLPLRDNIALALRELILRISHINRIKNPIINRLRQDLSWQFPEVAEVKSVRTEKNSIPLFWGWMSGQRESKRYDEKYKNTIGLGLQENARNHARLLCTLESQEAELESKLKNLLSSPDFLPYRRVFERFGFGEKLQAAIISQIYPLTMFLDTEKTPIIVKSRGRKSKKITTKYVSERRFLKMLGLAPTEKSSGDKSRKRISGGSSICRKGFWLWCFSSLEVKKRRTTPTLEALGNLLDQDKVSKPAQLARSRICGKAGKLLFWELVKSLSKE